MEHQGQGTEAGSLEVAEDFTRCTIFINSQILICAINLGQELASSEPKGLPHSFMGEVLLIYSKIKEFSLETPKISPVFFNACILHRFPGTRSVMTSGRQNWQKHLQRVGY